MRLTCSLASLRVPLVLTSLLLAIACGGSDETSDAAAGGNAPAGAAGAAAGQGGAGPGGMSAGGPSAGGASAGGPSAGGASTGGAGTAGAGGAAAGAGGSSFDEQVCTTSFCWSHPVARGDRLHAVTTVGDSVWVVGAATVMRRQGGAWSFAPAPDEVELRAVWAASSDDVWAVGDGGAIVHWDGASLRRVDSPTTVPLRGVWGSASDNLWAVGGEHSTGPVILHYDGQAWAPQPLGTSPEEEPLHAIWGRSATDVWVVGGELNVPIIGHWDGQSWQRSPHVALHGDTLLTVQGVGSRVLASTNGGRLVEVTMEKLDPPLAGWFGEGEVMVAMAARGPDDIWMASGNLLARNDLTNPPFFTAVGDHRDIEGITFDAQGKGWLVGKGIQALVGDEPQPELAPADLE